MHESHTLWIQGKGSNSIGAMVDLSACLEESPGEVYGAAEAYPVGHRHWKQLFLGHWAWTEVLASFIVEAPSCSLAPRPNPTNSL